MAQYTVEIKASASKELANLGADPGTRVSQAIDGLAANPRPSQCKKLKGSNDSYRIRIGNIRVLYQVDDGRKSVMVYAIGHRREVYR